MTGQEHITRTLSNALLSDRLAHAYLFCGPRGTGKTTTAKILARAMNCTTYPTAEPCGKCIPCQNIAAGVSIDVIEMDAASNRGIDEIRELRERSRFASGESRFKVYIIDEAHMLTPEACNAFLKTLEEPPPNVVFILATTDPSRLPATIVSRCQRFDFHLLTADQISGRLQQILKEEEWQAEDDAVELISRLSEGSLRDALGILEQCAAYGEKLISEEQVRIVTGSTRAETVAALAKAALDNDLDSGLKIINEVIYSGRDLTLFMRDLTFIFSRLLLDKPTGGKDQKGFSGLESLLASISQNLNRSLLLDAIELLHQTAGELRHTHFPQYILEISFIRLLRVLHGRLQPAPGLHLEQQIKDQAQGKGVTEPDVLPAAAEAKESDVLSETKEPAPPESGTAAINDQRPAPAEEPPTESGVPANGDRLEGLRAAWPDLLEEIKKRQKTTAAWLEPAYLADCRGHMVKLIYAPEYDIHRLRIMEEQHRKLLEAVLSNFFSLEMKVKAETGEQPTAEHKQEEKTTLRQTEPSPAKETRAMPKEDQPHKPSSSTPASNPKQKGISAEEAQKIFGGKIIEH
jgi:DNA polymerase III subunit gamma/tau